MLFLHLSRIVKMVLSCRRELNFQFLKHAQSTIFGKVENRILGLSCRRELNFGVFFNKIEKITTKVECRVFEGCPTPNARFYKKTLQKSKKISAKMASKMAPKSMLFSLNFLRIFGTPIFQPFCGPRLDFCRMLHAKPLFSKPVFFNFFQIFEIFGVPKSTQNRPLKTMQKQARFGGQN